MKRLGGTDALFLSMETPSWHQHVAGLTVLDPGDRQVTFEDVVKLIDERIVYAPKFRWKLQEVPFGLDRPVWVDDPDFDVRRHMHRIAVPSPGGAKEVGELAGNLGNPAGGRPDIADRCPGCVDRVGGLADEVGHRTGDEADTAGRLRGTPVVLGHLARRRLEVEDHGADVDRRPAVDHRVVGLRDDRDAPALEPLDEVDLPQGAVAVQLPALQAAHQVTELSVGARLGECGPAYVVGDVEVRVVDPHGVGDVSGDPTDLLAVPRHQPDPLLDQTDEPVVVEPFRWWFEDRHPADVHRSGRRLHVQEGDVERAQPVWHVTDCNTPGTSRVAGGPWRDDRSRRRGAGGVLRRGYFCRRGEPCERAAEHGLHLTGVQVRVGLHTRTEDVAGKDDRRVLRSLPV